MAERTWLRTAIITPHGYWQATKLDKRNSPSKLQDTRGIDSSPRATAFSTS